MYAMYNILKTKYEKLQAKNKRFRKALKHITQIDVWACDHMPQGDYACNQMKEIAEEALKGKDA